MGRVKLPLKKIENNTYRHITFSKRKSGLVKKAFELSTLCDIDLALIIFSPSGKLVAFSGNKRVEQVLKKYIDLPPKQRGRLPDEEIIRRLIDQMCQQVNASRDENSIMLDIQLEEIQNEIRSCNIELEDVEKQLGYFENSTVYSQSINEVEYHERILEDAMERLSFQKRVLEEKTEEQLPSQTLHPIVSVNNFGAGSSNYGSGFPQWLDHSPLMPTNFANPAIFRSLRNESERLVEFIPTAMDFHGASYLSGNTATGGASDALAPSMAFSGARNPASNAVGDDSDKFDYEFFCRSKFDRNSNADFTQIMGNIRQVSKMENPTRIQPLGITASTAAGPSQVAAAAAAEGRDEDSSSTNDFLNIPFLF